MVKDLSPVVIARDADASMAFYENVLGFEETSALRAPDGSVIHGMARSGDVMIQFSPAETRGFELKPDQVLGHGVTFSMHVDDDQDIDAYYATVVANGGKITEPIVDQPWGDRSFTVVDPDGYQLMFSKLVREMSMEEMQKELVPQVN